eukprot:COSAG02_NODE_2090_length_9866_cov_9.396642_5_plen_92_part_00
MLPKAELETRLRLGDLLARSNAHDTLGRARVHLDRAVRASSAWYNCEVSGCSRLQRVLNRRVPHVGPYADGLDEGRARRARRQVPCAEQTC